MKIFISYAHVNLPRVQQLADFLRMGGHDVWFDQRLVGGQPWREQLRSQINTSQCFLYALTPESVSSAWCQWEFSQAVHMGKNIVTVLLQPCDLGGVLKEHHYIDFTQGDSFEAGLRLGTAVFAAVPIRPERVALLPAPDDKPPEREIVPRTSGEKATTQRLYDEAFQAYRAKAYQEARDLLHDCLLIDDQQVEAQKLLVLVERRLEKDSVPSPRPPDRSTVGRLPDQAKPTTDPPPVGRVASSLSLRGKEVLPAPFEWIEIPAGMVTLTSGNTTVNKTVRHYLPDGESRGVEVSAFAIAKYPLTNVQYAIFCEAGGYQEEKWWTAEGWEWSRGGWGWNAEQKTWEPTGKPLTGPPFHWASPHGRADHPVLGITWYETIAFCRWLSEVIGQDVTLPTEPQWQRAAQGDDGRAYPWGNEWDEERCHHSKASTYRFVSPTTETTPVRKYEGLGDSPFGVVDMVGNAAEWCLTVFETGGNSLDETGMHRILRGGGCTSSSPASFRVDYCGFDVPTRRNMIPYGFRCVRV